jgi:hypothetical protein
MGYYILNCHKINAGGEHHGRGDLAPPGMKPLKSGYYWIQYGV